MLLSKTNSFIAKHANIWVIGFFSQVLSAKSSNTRFHFTLTHPASSSINAFLEHHFSGVAVPKRYLMWTKKTSCLEQVQIRTWAKHSWLVFNPHLVRENGLSIAHLLITIRTAQLGKPAAKGLHP